MSQNLLSFVYIVNYIVYIVNYIVYIVNYIDYIVKGPFTYFGNFMVN